MDHQPTQEEMDKILKKSISFKLTKYISKRTGGEVYLISDTAWAEDDDYRGFKAAIFMDEDWDLIAWDAKEFHGEYSKQEIH